MKSLFTLSLIAFFILGNSFIPIKKHKLPKALRGCKAVIYIPVNEAGQGDFYIFQHEVSNLIYLEFLYMLRGEQRLEELSVAEIDSLNWIMSPIKNPQPWVENYHKTKPNYPAVNITKAGAEAYCQWLSNIWNNQQDDFFVTFRLPLKAEWQYAFASDHHWLYPWGGPNPYNAKNCYLGNYKEADVVQGPAPVNSFKPNEFGLYNMSGNVAEWVKDDDAAYGGHWNISSEKGQRDDAYDVVKSSPYVGFRPIMTFTDRGS